MALYQCHGWHRDLRGHADISAATLHGEEEAGGQRVLHLHGGRRGLTHRRGHLNAADHPRCRGFEAQEIEQVLARHLVAERNLVSSEQQQCVCGSEQSVNHNLVQVFLDNIVASIISLVITATLYHRQNSDK